MRHRDLFRVSPRVFSRANIHTRIHTHTHSARRAFCWSQHHHLHAGAKTRTAPPHHPEIIPSYLAQEREKYEKKNENHPSHVRIQVSYKNDTPVATLAPRSRLPEAHPRSLISVRLFMLTHSTFLPTQGPPVNNRLNPTLPCIQVESYMPWTLARHSCMCSSLSLSSRALFFPPISNDLGPISLTSNLSSPMI